MQPGRVDQVHLIVVWLNKTPNRAAPAPPLYVLQLLIGQLYIFPHVKENQQQCRITSFANAHASKVPASLFQRRVLLRQAGTCQKAS